MIELLPRDNAPLSAEAQRVLGVLYDEFDRTSEPVEELTIVLALTETLSRPRSTVTGALVSQELAPYVRRENNSYVPTLRAALRLQKAADLEAATELYANCYGWMKQRRQQVDAGQLPERLRRMLRRLAHLLQYSGFGSISLGEPNSSGAVIHVHQSILDAATLSEFFSQQHGLKEAPPDLTTLPVAQTHLESLAIRGFRSFDDASVKGLGRLTVFAGPNEAGKTTLLKALEFLSASATGGVQPALNARGGLREVLRKADGVDSVSVQAALRATSPEQFLYSVSVSRAGRLLEDLIRFLDASAPLELGSDLSTLKHLALTEQHDDVRSLLTDGGEFERPVLAEGQSLLATLSDLAKFKTAISVRESLRRWAFYSFEPSSLRTDLTGANGTLQSDGRNLPAALNALGLAHPRNFKQLAEAFIDLLPEAQQLTTETGLSGRAILYLRERGLIDPLSHADFSDGMLRLLAILYLAFSPAKPTLVVIEEPENGLYPRLIEALLEVVRMLSRHTQVFLTTHSVSLLNRLQPEEVVFVHRDETGSHLERLDTRADVVKMAARFGLGAQLLMGNLEDKT